MQKYKDRIGHIYGRLTVVGFAGRNKASIKQKTVLWECNCFCGTTGHMVHARNLASGKVTSCGCLRKEQSRKAGISKALPGVEAAESRVYLKYKNLAKKRKIPFKLSKKDFLSMIYDNCNYCGSQPVGLTIAHRKYLDDVKITHNGIDRVDSCLGYSKSNCVPCCKNCNWAKLELSLDEFKNHIIKIAVHMSLIGKNHIDNK